MIGENGKQNAMETALLLSVPCKIYYQATSMQTITLNPSLPSHHTRTSTELSNEQPQTPQETYDLLLISKYLALSHQSSEESRKNSAQTAITLHPQDETFRKEEEGQNVKAKSSFHNFQKHLINTLKKYVKLKKIACLEKSKLRLAYELWQYFTSSHKSTKKLLYNILGDNLIHSQEFKKAPNSQNTELYELLSASDQSMVIASQAYLRNAIVKQSRVLLRGRLLKGRRMQRCEDFKSYFQNFVDELQGGEIMRRIPKEKKKCILENLPTIKNALTDQQF